LDALLTLCSTKEGWEYEKDFVVPHFSLFDLGIDQAVTKNENGPSVFVLARA
jgi:hypothetical protein